LSFASPGDSKGYVNLEKYDREANRMVEFRAHEAALRCMCFSPDGRFIATTSDTGTIVRIFDASPESVGKQLFEFRRGSDPADIYSMCFSPNGQFLLVNSDKFDAHVFCLDRMELNKTSSLNSFGFGLGSYLSSVWSAVSFELPKTTSKVAFVSDSEIVAISQGKAYYRFTLSVTSSGVTITKHGYKLLDQDPIA